MLLYFQAVTAAQRYQEIVLDTTFSKRDMPQYPIQTIRVDTKADNCAQSFRIHTVCAGLMHAKGRCTLNTKLA